MFGLGTGGFSLSSSCACGPTGSWLGSLTAVSALLVLLFLCQVPMPSLYPFESLCLQETRVSLVALKTSGPGYLGCRELQAAELWSRVAVGASGAIGAALSPSLFSFPIPISVLPTAAAAARQEPDKPIDICRRKAKDEFQSSARTAGIHQDCVFWFFSSLFLVFCVTVSGS